VYIINIQIFISLGGGHVITGGSTSSGITVQFGTNITVQNFIINGTTVAIDVESCTNCIIFNNSITNFLSLEIKLTYLSIQNMLPGMTAAILVGDSTNVKINNNTMRNFNFSENVLKVSNSSGARIIFCLFVFVF
jgi:hypothetical protein